MQDMAGVFFLMIFVCGAAFAAQFMANSVGWRVAELAGM